MWGKIHLYKDCFLQNYRYFWRVAVNIEQRKKVIADKLKEMGETLNSWATNNDLHVRIVNDLIEGKLTGTRGIAQEHRQKMEAAFGPIFED